MYSTCLFCAEPLGHNEVIEQFPIGRRLAFDAARGRLWVVCMVCRRWNLTPLEERWEAIEEAERLFRATRLRVSTGEIGLAKLREGLELVRVGAPQRPEIAAWRYGEQFSMRRRKQLLVGGAIAATGVLVTVGGLVAGISVVSAYQFGNIAMSYAKARRNLSTVAKLNTASDGLIRVRRRDLPDSMLFAGADGGLALRLKHAAGVADVAGKPARQAARQIFASVNRRGGTPADVTRAVARLEHAGYAERFLTETAKRGERLTKTISNAELRDLSNVEDVRSGAGLLALSTSLGLAIEMALHEEDERRALDGELAELHAAWREAEEVGAIADSLLLPESVERSFARLKAKL